MSVDVQPPPGRLGDQLNKILKGGIKYHVEDDPMVVWDKGVFLNELQKQGIVLSTNDNGAIDGNLEAKRGLTKGTFKGTSMALTEIYSLIEDAYSTPGTLSPKKSLTKA